MKAVFSAARTTALIAGIIFSISMAIALPVVISHVGVAHAQAAGTGSGGCCGGGGGGGNSGAGGGNGGTCQPGSFGYNSSYCQQYQCPPNTTGTYPYCTPIPPHNPPSEIIAISLTAASVCQTVNVHASFAAASGDTLTATSINEIPPNGGAEFIALDSGIFGGNSTVQSSLDYSFTPKVPGTYTFLPYAETAYYTTPQTIPSSQWVSVTVTGTAQNSCDTPPQCPQGYTGVYPNCTPPTYQCPTGTTGTFPNCVYTQSSNVINNKNNNTNNNNNTNSAPVTQTVNTNTNQYPQNYQNYQYQQNSAPVYVSNSASLAVSGYMGSYGYHGYGMVAEHDYQAPPAPIAYGGYMQHAPSYPSVSLTQIPYTGFDGDSAYWASIVAVAASMLCLLMYYHNGTYAYTSGLFRKMSSTFDQIRGSRIA